MFPDRRSAPFLEPLNLLAASSDQIIALGVGEITEGVSDGVVVTLSPDDPVPAQDTARHLLHDLRVVVDLALVVRKDGSGDGPNRGTPAARQEHLQHQRLVDVSHLHLFVEELGEALVGG